VGRKYVKSIRKHLRLKVFNGCPQRIKLHFVKWLYASFELANSFAEQLDLGTIINGTTFDFSIEDDSCACHEIPF